ncbi:MAG: 50S ribosomal protein L19 [Parcubacteria group bacterium GW2011_GWD2_42_14]|nr:MAG: 50S ribosomal protein L19 [Parcubacteria group bacterium GW2011_GWD2_42_14]
MNFITFNFSHLHGAHPCGTVPRTMTTQEVISPVNIEARKELGVRSGDTVRVTQKIKEKGKVRLQVFEGLVLMVKHGTEAGATFTVRKVASGVGVEKTFPLYSPMIDKIEIVKRTKVRRAKLYYIREKATKEIRRAMRKAFAMGTSIESDTTEKERIVKEASAKVATEEAEKKRMEELASAEATASKEEIPVEPALASEETPAEETK